MSLLLQLSAGSKMIVEMEMSREKRVNSHREQPGTQHHFNFVSSMTEFAHLPWLEPTYIQLQLISQGHL